MSVPRKKFPWWQYILGGRWKVACSLPRKIPHMTAVVQTWAHPWKCGGSAAALDEIIVDREIRGDASVKTQSHPTGEPAGLLSGLAPGVLCYLTCPLGSSLISLNYTAYQPCRVLVTSTQFSPIEAGLCTGSTLESESNLNCMTVLTPTLTPGCRRNPVT